MWPGIILLITRCLVMLCYLYSLRLTYRDESMLEKLKFYRQLGIAFTLWFLLLPVCVAFAMTAEWVYRAKIILTIQTVLDFCAYASLAYLLWPTRIAEHFRIAPPTVFAATSGATSQSTPYGSI